MSRYNFSFNNYEPRYSSIRLQKIFYIFTKNLCLSDIISIVIIIIIIIIIITIFIF